jgi:hypothetical protein
MKRHFLSHQSDGGREVKGFFRVLVVLCSNKGVSHELDPACKMHARYGSLEL